MTVRLYVKPIFSLFFLPSFEFEIRCGYTRRFPKSSPWENRSHSDTKSCFPVVNSHLPMGKTVSVTTRFAIDYLPSEWRPIELQPSLSSPF